MSLPRSLYLPCPLCAPTSCWAHLPFLSAVVDGELDQTLTLNIEEHIVGCEGCRERVQFLSATKRTVRQLVRKNGVLSTDLRSRIEASIQTEALLSSQTASFSSFGAGDQTVNVSPRRAWFLTKMSSRSLFPDAFVLAALVGAALFYASLKTYKKYANDSPQVEAVHPETTHTDRMAEYSPLGEMLEEHARPLPPETKEVQKLEPYVGVPVKAFSFKRFERSNFVGGRILPLNHERAAMLQYEIDPNDREGTPGRVSVFVYDARRIHMSDTGLSPRAVGSSEVQIGRSGGYSIAVTQHDGVGYAVASDMDLDINAKLAADLNQ